MGMYEEWIYGRKDSAHHFYWIRTVKSEALNNIMTEYITLMESTSKILISENTNRHALKYRELTRGLYNNQLNKIGRIKKEKEMVKIIWERNYLNVRKYIWFMRCTEVIEIESKEPNVTTKDKKRKRMEGKVEENNYEA